MIPVENPKNSPVLTLKHFPHVLCVSTRFVATRLSPSVVITPTRFIGQMRYADCPLPVMSCCTTKYTAIQQLLQNSSIVNPHDHDNERRRATTISLLSKTIPPIRCYCFCYCQVGTKKTPHTTPLFGVNKYPFKPLLNGRFRHLSCLSPGRQAARQHHRLKGKEQPP